MAGASLTVLKIEKILKNEIFKASNYSFKEQTTFDLHGSEIKDLGLPKTEIQKHFLEAGFRHYSVKMSTETIKEPIYIYDNEYIEWMRGYQKIENFEFWINDDTLKMYIFAPKQIASTFIRRLKKEQYIMYSDIQFDFSKIGELEKLDSAWGTWEDSVGIVNRTAKFGKGLNTIITDFSKITTFYIDYKYGGKLKQLILSAEGRISSQSSLTNRDIFIIYNEISTTLLSKT